ncbi:PBP1A family penicillin-binding protein [Jannaschia sp.]|nr:PBP1A family penicillin-binding protein [Jannaschia sp.]
MAKSKDESSTTSSASDAPGPNATGPDATGSNASAPDTGPRPGADPTLSTAAATFGRALVSETSRLARRSGTATASASRQLRAQVSERLKQRRAAIDAGERTPLTASIPATVKDWLQTPMPTHVPSEQSRGQGRSILTGAALLFGVILVVGSLAAAGVVLWAMRGMPVAEILPPLEEPRLEMVTSDGDPLFARGAYRGAYLGLEEMPEALIDAVVATEDRRFFDHGGVDMRGIARAAVANIRGGGIVQGGSTITQQLVKVLYLTPERTLQRKLQEVVLAMTLEHQLGKDRILELYLNSVYLGGGAWGASAASEVYFGHDLEQLSLAEAAILAAAIKAPSLINLFANAPAARERADLVLRLMHAQDRISDADLLGAQAELALLNAVPRETRAGSYYVDWVLSEAQELSEAVDGQLTITATLDPQLQQDAERIVSEIMSGPGQAAGASQAALIAMTADGKVRAMVGGVDYGESQFNRATDAMRQPGSTFKLPVFLAALSMGLTPQTVISDAPIEIDGWSPQNYSGTNNGDVTLTEAFARSLNAATVRLATEIGIDNVVQVARQLGIDSDLTEQPSLALGASEVTLLDMTEAYASVLAGRLPIAATGVASMALGDTGTRLSVPATGPDAVDMIETRDPMLEMLRAVVTDGTGRGAELEGFSAGKTGTSQDSRDAWFIGFSDSLVIGVWVGNDDSAPMDNVTGGSLPVDIWRAVMASAPEMALAAPVDASSPAQSFAPEAEPVQQCNIRACSRFYRSFRASDCTFQPYRGGRKICTR